MSESAQPHVNESTRPCFSCAYWDPCSNDMGKCRRHAPAAVTATVTPSVPTKGRVPVSTAPPDSCDPANGLVAAWPLTGSHDWCGEWTSHEALFQAPEATLSGLESLLADDGPPLDPEEERTLRNASIAQALLVLPAEKRDKLLLEVLTDEERASATPPDDFYERVQGYLAAQGDDRSE